MTRYVCIHGHFYQPLRENPWLEEIELQDSARPYHDWNERVTFECYAPNTAARIFGAGNKIIDITNNYKKISHNFGPTLLSWIEAKEPETLRSILETGNGSHEGFSGHSPAMAQAYNHMIMPLSNFKDRRTQVIWGIKEYEHRLGRKPDGMWLPETAIDRKSLDIMAEQGIKFVIVAPHQIARYRKIGDTDWIDPSLGMDIKMPYLCRLESERTINLFVYDEEIAKAVAFNNLLDSGEAFAERLVNEFSGVEHQLVHVATDGETYGHHHSGGDMALAYCIYHIESKNLAKITVYGEYLEKHPSTYEAEIAENTSWSCPHGVERWKSDCGCNTGGHPDWNQAWRTPLRQAMDWLRDALIPMYEQYAAAYFKDPWDVRDDYIEVILKRSSENLERFLSEHASRDLSRDEKVKALKLLEMQRHAMLMYASDGWFFDEISGTEAVQVMRYAARAMQLARDVNGVDLEPEYTKILKQAKSNIEHFEDGEKIYEMFVKPAALDLLRVAVHYAMSSLFSDYPEKARIFCYTVDRTVYDFEKAGEEKLAVGKIHVRSDITLEEDDISLAVIHFGNHNLLGGAHRFKGDEPYNLMQKEIKDAFAKSDIPEVIHLMDKHFGTHNYTIWHLFKDEQRKVFNNIIEPSQAEIETFFRQTYDRNYPVMQVMKDLGVTLPEVFQIVINSAIDRDLKRSLNEDKLDLDRLKKLVEEVQKFSPELDKLSLNFIASQRIDSLMENLSRTPEDLDLMGNINDLLVLMGALTLEPNLWKAQNILFSLSRQLGSVMKDRADRGDQNAKRWVDLLGKIEERLQVRTS